MTINLIARIPTAVENRDAVAKLLREYGQVVRTEPGNLRFEVYASGDDLVVIERYADQGAFDNHLEAPENAAVNSALAALLRGGGSHLEMLDSIDDLPSQDDHVASERR